MLSTAIPNVMQRITQFEQPAESAVNEAATPRSYVIQGGAAEYFQRGRYP
jgi:hypothetical protein